MPQPPTIGSGNIRELCNSIELLLNLILPSSSIAINGLIVSKTQQSRKIPQTIINNQGNIITVDIAVINIKRVPEIIAIIN